MLSTSMLVELPLGNRFGRRLTAEKLPECHSLPDVDHEHGQSQVKSLQLREILSGSNRETRGGVT